jgi:hypothetical protein
MVQHYKQSTMKDSCYKPQISKPILVPKSLSKILDEQACRKARCFEADYMDGAHDLWVLLHHKLPGDLMWRIERELNTINKVTI